MRRRKESDYWSDWMTHVVEILSTSPSVPIAVVPSIEIRTRIRLMMMVMMLNFVDWRVGRGWIDDRWVGWRFTIWTSSLRAWSHSMTYSWHQGREVELILDDRACKVRSGSEIEEGRSETLKRWRWVLTDNRLGLDSACDWIELKESWFKLRNES